MPSYTEPRSLTPRDTLLLRTMADELMRAVSAFRDRGRQTGPLASAGDATPPAGSGPLPA